LSDKSVTRQRRQVVTFGPHPPEQMLAGSLTDSGSGAGR